MGVSCERGGIDGLRGERLNREVIANCQYRQKYSTPSHLNATIPPRMVQAIQTKDIESDIPKSKK